MSQVLELAKQGDTNAIAALINRSLTPQGIKARVVLQNTTLKVLLESLEVPDQNRFTNYIIQGLRKIEFTSATALEIFGKQSGSEGYAWTEAFQIDGDNFTPMVVAQPPSTPQSKPQSKPQSNSQSNSQSSHSSEGDHSFSVASGSAAGNPMVQNQVAELDPTQIQNLAKQGNIDAIEAFVKSALSDREGLESFVELDHGVLKVTIETKQFLDGPAFCGELGQKLNQIASDKVVEAEIYKRKSEKAMPFLMKKVTLQMTVQSTAQANGSSPQSSLTHTNSTSSSSNTTRSIEVNSSAHRSNNNFESSHSADRYTESQPHSHLSSSSGSKSRPDGITWIAILYFVLGGLGIALGSFAIFGSFAINSMANQAAAEGVVIDKNISGLVFLLGYFTLAINVGRIIVGFGLMQMQSWGLIGTYIVEGLSLLTNVLNLFTGASYRLGVGFFIAFGILKYVSQEDVRLRFK